MQGIVKLYDPITGAGIVVSDSDRREVLLRAGTLGGSVFRSLRQGQRIVFDVIDDGGQSFASNIRLGVDGS
ncbi:MAG: cold-shock protein [Acidimicrobiia bacterium]|jgi:CspA family cold shock protein|nr:cold-shock protein [Acidimicrobiia bacterium]